MDRKLQKGLLLVFAANALHMLLALASNFLLPKYLPVGSYATIKEFQLYSAYAGIFHFGFVDGIYLQYGGKDLAGRQDGAFWTDLSSMRSLQFLLSLILLCGAILGKNTILLFFVLSIFPQNMGNYFKFLYQATGNFKRYAGAMNISSISTFLIHLFLLFVLKSDSAVWYISAQLLLFFALWLVLELSFRRRYGAEGTKLFFAFSPESCCRHIQAGFLLTVGNLSSIFLSGMDRWFVKLLMDQAAFARYSFAVSVESFLHLALTPLTITLYNYFCRERDKRKHRGIFVCTLLFASLLPAAAFIVKALVESFLPAYVGGMSVLFLLFAAQMFYTVIKSIYVNLYKVERRQKHYFGKLAGILLLGFLLNGFLYALLRSKEAFALGTLLSAFVWFVWSGRDFTYLRENIGALPYLTVQTAVFLLLGHCTSALWGLVLYMLCTAVFGSIFLGRELYVLWKQRYGMKGEGQDELVCGHGKL